VKEKGSRKKKRKFKLNRINSVNANQAKIEALTLFHAAVYGMRTMQHKGRKAQIKLGCLDLCRLERIPILTAVGQ
jgi:hypothetical protein